MKKGRASKSPFRRTPFKTLNNEQDTAKAGTPCALPRGGRRESDASSAPQSAPSGGRAYSPRCSVLSRPQAARMSSPREARMVVWMPRAVSASRKRTICSSGGEK